MAKKLKLFSEVTSKLFISVGLLLLILFAVLFWVNDHNFDCRYQINDEKLSSFGDLIGGLVGSIWALAGFILYYVALKDQRKDIKINQDTLEVQIKTLNQQVEEYKLQRDELVQTRNVLNEQSKTLSKQQFESTFFNSLNLLSDIISKIIVKNSINEANRKTKLFENDNPLKDFNGKDSFIYYLTELKAEYHKLVLKDIVRGISKDSEGKTKVYRTKGKELENAKNASSMFFNQFQTKLGQYYRTVYNIIKFIDKNNSKIEDIEFYTDLLRDQFSSEELVLLFYYGIAFDDSKLLKNYISKYKFLKNLNMKLVLDPKHIELYSEEY